MSEPLPELSADALAMLAAGRLRERVPAAVATRMWQHVAVALPGAHGPVAPSAHAGAAAKLAKAYSLKQVVLVGAGLFGLGMGAGVGTTVAVRHRLSPPVGPSAPSPIAARAPEPVPPSAATLPPNPLPPPPSKAAHVDRSIEKPKATPVVPPAQDVDLAGERALIARARSALQRGAPADALSALETHASQFPDGRLSEQREALRVQALVSIGKRAEAERAAAEFARKYPESLMGPAVQEAVRPNP